MREPRVEGPAVLLHHDVRPAQDLRHQGQRVHAGGGGRDGGREGGCAGAAGGEVSGVLAGAAAVADADHDGAEQLLVVGVQVNGLGGREGGGWVHGCV